MIRAVWISWFLSFPFLLLCVEAKGIPKEGCSSLILGNMPAPPQQAPPKPKAKAIKPGSGKKSPGRTRAAFPGAKTPGSGVTARGVARGPARPSSSRGAFTRPFWTDPSLLVSWEEWWLRNRHRYLRFTAGPAGTFPSAGAAALTARRRRIDRESLRSRSAGVFRSYLAHGSARLRAASVLGLGLLEDRASVEKILAMVKDSNLDVQVSAVMSLGCFGEDAQARAALLHLAEGTGGGDEAGAGGIGPIFLRPTALMLLAGTAPKVALPLLERAAAERSSTQEVRTAALFGLGLAGDEAGVMFLEEFLRGGRLDPPLVQAALSAFGIAESPLGLPWVLECLKSRDAGVRQTAALIAGRVATAGDVTMARRLFHCYGNTRDRVLRGFALLSLGMVGGPEALDRLERLAGRCPTLDRAWMCLGLGLAARGTEKEKVRRRVLSVLLRVLEEDPGLSPRKAAALALGLAEYREASPAFTKIVKAEGDPALRGYGALALGMVRDGSALPLLREVIGSEKSPPPLAAGAALALALLNDRVALPRLLELLVNTGNEETKATAARCLIHLGDLYVAEWLVQRLEEKRLDETTTLYAVGIVSKLVKGREVSVCQRAAACSNYTCELPLLTYLFDFDL